MEKFVMKSNDIDFDVVVIGSGCIGSVISTILANKKYKVLMLEKGTHPRFSLGESSTPLTTFLFKKFADSYQIPEFEKYSSYNNMKEKTNLNCGPKGIFYYLNHKENKEANFEGETIVQTRTVDLQYDRKDLDLDLVKLASEKYNVTYRDNTEIIDFDDTNKNFIKLSIKDSKHDVSTIYAKFVLDCSGFNSFIANSLNIKNEIHTPLNSRSIFSHVKNLIKIDDLSEEIEGIKKFDGTQHHYFDGGWLWIIPFDNGITSVGFNLDNNVYPMNSLSATEEFELFINKFPTLKKIFENVEYTMPIIKTGRLQFKKEKYVGNRWAMLPAAVMGIDAWQSTGLTIGMLSIQRLVWILDNLCFKNDDFSIQNFNSYIKQLDEEYLYINLFVSAIYKSFKYKNIFELICLLPFIGVEKFVLNDGLNRPWDPTSLFMSFGDPLWLYYFNKIIKLVDQINEENSKQIEEEIRNILVNDLKEFNSRNYGKIEMQNKYLMNMSKSESQLNKFMGEVC